MFHFVELFNVVIVKIIAIIVTFCHNSPIIYKNELKLREVLVVVKSMSNGD